MYVDYWISSGAIRKALMRLSTIRASTSLLTLTVVNDSLRPDSISKALVRDQVREFISHFLNHLHFLCLFRPKEP